MIEMSKREFLKTIAGAVPAAFLPCLAFNRDAAAEKLKAQSSTFKGDAPEELWKFSHETLNYRKLGENTVVCTTCPNQCLLAPKDRGICRSRVNMDGTLYSIAYGNPCAVNIDPVEKKPLYHFMPSSRVFSVAQTGCNFRCLNCQNWTISQKKPEEVKGMELFPDQAVKKALQYKSDGMAYTYSEATTWYEYMIHTAESARRSNLFNLYISNGYINRDPLEKLCRVIHGANINLKAFDNALYRDLCAGTLDPVLNTLKTLHENKIHLEITNLVVPEYTDDPARVKAMCSWIIETLGPDHPLHFLRFFPKYKLDRLSPTPVSLLEEMRAIAMAEGIRYVYIGNVPGHEANHTYCPSCKKTVINRYGYSIDTSGLSGNTCRFCGTSIAGVWEQFQKKV